MKEKMPLRKIVDCVGDLPAMPEIVAEVLPLTEDPSTAMSKLSEVIQRDPALTAKILRVSNSPCFGMRQYVGTLKLALVILGVREIRNIVLGITVFDVLRNDNTTVLLAHDFWRHSFMVAAIAKKIGTHLEIGFHGEDFISGLLHDIGKMVLISRLGKPYAALCKEGERLGPLDLCRLEQQELGFTHADAGAALATKWNFPTTLCDALWMHHPVKERALASAKDPCLAAIVRVANLADYHMRAPNPEAAAWIHADDEPWQHLRAGFPEGPVHSKFETLTEWIADVDQTAIPVIA